MTDSISPPFLRASVKYRYNGKLIEVPDELLTSPTMWQNVSMKVWISTISFYVKKKTTAKACKFRVDCRSASRARPMSMQKNEVGKRFQCGLKKPCKETLSHFTRVVYIGKDYIGTLRLIRKDT